jgi:hypothetical protein
MTKQKSNLISTNVDDEISLKEFILRIRAWFKFLLSKWMQILIIGLLGMSLGYIYAFYSKPVFTAETTFVLEEDSGGAGMLGQLGGLAGMAGIDVGGGGGGLFQGDNIIQLYKSRSMVEKTLLSEVENNNQRQLLINRYIEFNKQKNSWYKNEMSEDSNFILSGRY